MINLRCVTELGFLTQKPLIKSLLSMNALIWF